MVQKKKILLFFYFFITPIIIVFFLELLLSIYFKSFKIPTENRFKFRYMLYSNDSDSKHFDEYKNFFKYKPNLLSRHLLYYYEENNFLEIWDYKFNTNNFGLVQKSDIFLIKNQFFSWEILLPKDRELVLGLIILMEKFLDTR